MKYTIKNRYTDKVMYEGEAESFIDTSPDWMKNKEPVKEYWSEGESLTLKQEKDGSWKPAIPESYYPEWWEKLFCFFGRHNWTYSLPQEKRCTGCVACTERFMTGKLCIESGLECWCHQNTLIIEDKIPDYATCVVCGTKYGK